jgi:hypothetical protein
VPVPPLAALPRWSAVTVTLRAVLLASGVVALVLAPGGRLLGPGVVALVGALGLLVAVARPDGPGPAVVLGAASLAWVIRYGTSPPPVVPTLLLAAALAMHHQAAALDAALPPTARVDPAVLLRFGAHAAVVLALSSGTALVALGVARPGGSVPLELAGFAAAVAATAVLVALARGPGGRG